MIFDDLKTSPFTKSTNLDQAVTFSMSIGRILFELVGRYDIIDEDKCFLVVQKIPSTKRK